LLLLMLFLQPAPEVLARMLLLEGLLQQVYQ
jgi:hypothetical protein